ncbi:MAG: DNA-directed RNA polymerase sigma-70 factor [Lysobacteraceae bacterium]|nr:MAG: DNA-directed RNA polymerase sigma-70 factor [Xanthomonadaceae bacterium]
MKSSKPEITILLGRWREGDRNAESELIEAVYPMMRDIARRQLRSEGPGMTLQATDLANEAYLKLSDHDRLIWQNRGHFLAIVTTVIRRLIVDHAKTKRRKKRGGDAVTVALHDLSDANAPRTAVEFDVLALDEALNELAQTSEIGAKVVTLRFFGGLGLQEVADVLDRSISSITRDWQFSRAWLHRRLSQ